MAFPNVLSVTPTGVTTGTSHTIDMPATVAAGDLLLTVMTWNGDGAATTNGVPSGWSEIGEVSDPPFGYISVLGKIAVGDEGGTTVNFTTSVGAPVICHVFRIEEGTWLGSLTGVELGSGVASSGTNPDPPSLTASWGALENLWIAVAQSTETEDFTAIPANYTNGAETSLADGGEGELSMNTAYRQNAVATENPGTFTMGTAFWLATTVVVQPFNPYPQVLSTTPSVRALVAQTVSWPAATDAGDLLLVFGLATTAISAIAGCTELTSGTLDTYDFGVWAKIADGSEDGGTAAVTGPGSSDLGIYHALRIEAGTWIGSLGGLIVSAIAEGTSTAPDPPEATGPSADYLAVACAGIEEEGGFSSGPSGYTGFTSSDDTINSSMATAHREVTGTTENPGTFTFASTADPWGAVTVLVPPFTIPEAGTVAQEGFRFRNDDGSESAATWVDLQDVPLITGMTVSAGFAFTTDVDVLANIPDDLEVIVLVRMDDWNPGEVQTFVSKRDGGNEWQFRSHFSSPRPNFVWWLAGVPQDIISDTDWPFENGSIWWLRVRRSGTTVQFFYAPFHGSDYSTVSWVQLGGNVTTSAGSIDDAAVVRVVIGAAGATVGEPLNGTVFAAAILDDTTPIASPIFSYENGWEVGDNDPGPGTGDQGTDAQGNVWELGADAEITGGWEELTPFRLRFLSDAEGNDPPTQQLTLKYKRVDEDASEWRNV